MVMTLAQLEAGRIARGGQATDTPVYSVGRAGTTYAGKTGDKVHVIISHPSFGTEAACGARNNGTSRFSPIEAADTDRVTCSKCSKWLVRMEQF